VKPILDTTPEPHEDDRPKDDDTVKTPNIAEEPVYVKNAVSIVIAMRILIKVSNIAFYSTAFPSACRCGTIRNVLSENSRWEGSQV